MRTRNPSPVANFRPRGLTVRVAWLALFTLALALAPALGADVRALRWPELIPDHLADAPVRPPPPASHEGPRSLDQLSPWGDLPMSELLVPGLDRQRVELSGYVVPLNLTEAGRVDEFLLVPYFGACIHVPPPPPNQVVYVTAPEGLDADRLYEAWTVRGTLRVDSRASALARAGYTLAADDLRLYGY